MPAGRAYKETLDQLPMTRLIDTGEAQLRSRSFRRFWKAVREITVACDERRVEVTPSGE